MQTLPRDPSPLLALTICYQEEGPSPPHCLDRDPTAFPKPSFPLPRRCEAGLSPWHLGLQTADRLIRWATSPIHRVAWALRGRASYRCSPCFPNSSPLLWACSVSAFCPVPVVIMKNVAKATGYPHLLKAGEPGQPSQGPPARSTSLTLSTSPARSTSPALLH